MNKTRYFLFFSMLFLFSFLCGCNIEKYDDTKINDIDFAIVSEDDIPDAIRTIIDGCRDTNFRKTYSDNNFLYIIIGYGAQPTTGYSITIEDIYEAKNAIFISSMLKGPSKKESVSDTITYPYVVLKLQYTDKTVIFK